jgi:hypothetical protein
MRYSYHFTQLPRILLSAFLPILVVSAISVSSRAQQPADPERKVEPPVHTGPGASPPATSREDETKSLHNMGWTVPPPKTIISPRPDGKPRRDVDIVSEEQYEQGNVTVAIGNVRVSDGEILIIADRITYNNATSDVLAEGNVFLEQQGQRLSGETLEFNYKTRRGVIRSATGFTNTTPDGVTVVVEAPRADKTGEDTYNLENAMLTACQQRIPKWSFTAKRARIRLDHRAKVYNAFFRIRNIPVLWLPYASISISKKDRSSGFLTPSSGSSTIKGRTFHLAYFSDSGTQRRRADQNRFIFAARHRTRLRVPRQTR